MKKLIIVAMVALLLIGVVFAEDLPTSFSLTGFVTNSDGNSVGADKIVNLFNINRSENATTTTFFSLGLYSTAIIGLEGHHVSMNATNGTHIGRLLLILPTKTGDITEVNNVNITMNAFPTLSPIVFNDTTPASFADVSASSTYGDLEGVAGTIVFQWFVNSVNVFNQSFGSVANVTTLTSVLDASNFGVSDSVKVTVLGTDQEYDITTDSATITVVNTLPIASNVVISPLRANTTDTLTVSFSFLDGDGNSESGSKIRWTKNGVDQTALENLTSVSSGLTTYKDLWQAFVTPNDGFAFGNEVFSLQRSIFASSPTVSALLCDRSSGFEDCGNTEFNDTISAIRVNCTDADNDITSVGYELKNLFDNSVIASATNSTSKVGDLFTLTQSIPILDSGDWNLTVTCNDDSGNSSVVSDAWSIAFGSVNAFMLSANATVINDQNFTFSTRATCSDGECVNVVALLDPKSTSFDITLEKDWNLISLPVTSEGKGIEEMLASIDGKYTVVAGFDAEGAKVYDPRLRLFSDLTALDPRQGYWVKMSEPATLRVEGEEAAMDTLALKPGWNLIAVPLSLSQNGLNDVAMSIEPSDAVNAIYRYDAASKQYDVARHDADEGWGSADDFEALEAGRGYWVRSNQDASIIFATIQSLVAKGLIPENSGNPFFTTSTNPEVSGCLVSIKPGDTCDTTWNVVANGTQGESFAFFTNYSTTVNVTTPIAQISINAPPSVVGVSITPGGAVTSNDLGANFVFIDGDGNANAGTRIQWFKDTVEQTALENISTVGSGNTSKGQEWKITVTPFDGLEFGSSVTSATVTIASTAPTVSVVAFNDSSVQTLEDVSASSTYADVDADAGTLTFRWFVDSSLVFTDVVNVAAGAAGSSALSGANYSKGQLVNVSVTGNDGGLDSSTVNSATFVVVNTAPTVDQPTFNDSSVTTLEDVSAFSEYTDADAEAGTLTFRWFVDSSLVFTDVVNVAADAEGTSVLDSTNYTKGQTVNVSVEANDGSVSSAVVNSVSFVIVNTAPVASNVAIAPVQPQTVDDLNATFTYSDADSDAESGSLIRWFKDNQEQTALENVTTVDGSNTARDEVWFFRVRPRDGFVLGAEVQSGSVTIGSTAPVVSAAVFNDTSLQTFEDVRANSTYNDIDGDVGTITFRWFVDGSLVFTDAVGSVAAGNAGSSVLDSSNYTKGQTINVSAQANDGGVSGLVVNSGTLTVVNTAPSASDVSVVPLLPSSDDAVNVSFTFSDLDSDAESGSLIRWFKDSGEQTALENVSSVAAVNTAKGEEWNARVTPRDGSVFGSEVTSNTVTIGGVRSTVTVPTFNDSSVQTFEDVSASTTYSDTDGDAAFVIFTWSVNGGVVFVQNVTSVASGTVASSVLDASNYVKGNSISVAVQSFDGDVPSTVATSVTLTVVNTAPSASNLVIDDAKTEDDLNLTFDFSDIDSDSESGSLIRWFKDSVEQPSLENLTIVGSGNTSKGQDWSVAVTPSDGDDFGVEVFGGNTTISNTAPVVVNLTIDPNPAAATDTLNALFVFTDADSDVSSGTRLQWFRNGGDVPELENLTTVLASNTVKGQRWFFRVTPSDGTQVGDAVDSGNVTIGNVPPLLVALRFNDTNLQTQEVIGAIVNFSDADGDTSSVTFRWFVDNVSVVNDTIPTARAGLSEIPGPVFNNISGFYSEGQTVRVDVSVNDGSVDGNSLTLSTVVVNTAPLMSTPVINNTSPIQFSDVLGTTVYTDADEEAGTVQLTWFVNGTLAKTSLLEGVPNGTTIGLSLEANFTSIGDILNFTAIASDGDEQSVLVSTSVVVEPACTVGQTKLCDNQVGVCSGATQTCNNGEFSGCGDSDFLAHNTSYAATENNCDGLDNDCDGNADETGASFCSDGSFCNGVEVCGGLAGCGAGTVVSCTGNDLSLISTCGNNPDNNAFTFDYAAAFTSSCDEVNDVCTSGVQTPTHTCNATACGSVCEAGDTNTTNTLVCQGGNVFRQVLGCSTDCAFIDSVAADVLEITCELGCSNGACVDDDHSPSVDTFSPTNLNPTINEGESISFSAAATDPDGKSVSLRWLVDDVVQKTRTTFTYVTSFTDAGVHTITLEVSNGRFTSEKTWSVTVTDVAAVDEPDLTVSGLKLFFPQQAVVDGLSIYRFTIKNVGVGAANNFLWQLNTGESLLTAGAPLTLAAGSEVEVYKDLRYVNASQKTVTVTVDHTGVVTEENETNNAQTIQVVVS